MTTAAWTHRTLIVPAAMAPTCRALAAALSPGGEGMWITPLSSTGAEPATHYISAGLIDAQLAALLDSPDDMAAATGIDVSQARAILAACDVSTESGLTAMGRLGLRLMASTDES